MKMICLFSSWKSMANVLNWELKSFTYLELGSSWIISISSELNKQTLKKLYELKTLHFVTLK